MHNIYLLQKFVLDHTVTLPTNSTPGLSISDQEKERKSDTILYYSIWAIRNSLPSENQEYTPFIESINDEDRTC